MALLMTVMEMDMEGLVVLRGCGEEDPGAVRGAGGRRAGGQARRARLGCCAVVSTEGLPVCRRR